MRLLLLLLVASAAHADPIVDWAVGRIAVTAAAAADLRAPSPAIARVAAERTARGRARAALLEAARALPWAAGGTLGAHADQDPEAEKALAAAVDGATTEELRLQSDGSVVVRIAASLDALAGVSPTTERAGLVADGRGHVRPALGYHLVAGGETYSGPVRFARAGEAKVRVSRAHGDELVLPAGALDKAAPPVLILVGESR